MDDLLIRWTIQAVAVIAVIAVWFFFLRKRDFLTRLSCPSSRPRADITLTREKLDSWARGQSKTLFSLEQDEDLILADRAHLGLMLEFLNRKDILLEKGAFIASALGVLLALDRSEENISESIADGIKVALRSNKDAVRAALEDVGMEEEVVLRKVIGEPFPADYPEWLRRKYDAA